MDDAGQPDGGEEMTPDDVLAVLAALDAAGVRVVVDGGWGVDALLAAQTRPHRDLDLVVARDDVPRASAALASLGYRHDPHVRPGLPARHVLRAADGRQVDVHVVRPDGRGDWRQDLDDGSFGVYPGAELRAGGAIGGRPVRCISGALQLRHHQGYDPLDHDRHDLALLEGLTTPPGGRHSS